jgi:hypothetical protein
MDKVGGLLQAVLWNDEVPIGAALRVAVPERRCEDVRTELARQIFCLVHTYLS